MGGGGGGPGRLRLSGGGVGRCPLPGPAGLLLGIPRDMGAVFTRPVAAMPGIGGGGGGGGGPLPRGGGGGGRIAAGDRLCTPVLLYPRCRAYCFMASLTR